MFKKICIVKNQRLGHYMDFQVTSRLNWRRDNREADTEICLQSWVCHSFWHFTGLCNANRWPVCPFLQGAEELTVAAERAFRTQEKAQYMLPNSNPTVSFITPLWNAWRSQKTDGVWVGENAWGMYLISPSWSGSIHVLERASAGLWNASLGKELWSNCRLPPE